MKSSLLLPALLLLTACFGETVDNPTPTPQPTATPGNIVFIRDGQTVTQRATATLEAGSAANSNRDVLHIRSADFATTAGTEYVDVQFFKPSSTGDVNYQLLGIYSSARNGFYTYGAQATVTKVGTGWSGGFVGGFQETGSSLVSSTITSGSFSDVK
jgi:hypothetical protein